MGMKRLYSDGYYYSGFTSLLKPEKHLCSNLEYFSFFGLENRGFVIHMHEGYITDESERPRNTISFSFKYFCDIPLKLFNEIQELLSCGVEGVNASEFLIRYIEQNYKSIEEL